MGRPKGSKNKPKTGFNNKSLREVLNDVLKNSVESFTGTLQESVSPGLIEEKIEQNLKPYVINVPKVEVNVTGSDVTARFVYDNTNFQYPQGSL